MAYGWKNKAGMLVLGGALGVAAMLSGALAQPVHAETNVYQSDSFSCREKCEAKRKKAEEKCQKIPKKEKNGVKPVGAGPMRSTPSA